MHVSNLLRHTTDYCNSPVNTEVIATNKCILLCVCMCSNHIICVCLWSAVMSLPKYGLWNMLSKIILPEVIQIIPAIEAETQGVFLKTQSTEKLPHSLWCTLEDRHLRWDKADRIFYREPGVTSFLKKKSFEAVSYLFLPAVASISMHRGAISITWPLVEYGWASLFCGEEVHFAEGLGHLQSSEGVVPCRSRGLLIHHPGNRDLRLCYVSGDVGESWRRLGCPNRIGSFWEELMLIPSVFFPDDCWVIHI